MWQPAAKRKVVIRGLLYHQSGFSGQTWLINVKVCKQLIACAQIAVRGVYCLCSHSWKKSQVTLWSPHTANCTPSYPEAPGTMKVPKLIGRCTSGFYIAVVLDLVGIIFLILGVSGSFTYWDFFIYTGAIVIALSLLFWILWYTFNVEVPHKELELAYWTRDSQGCASKKKKSTKKTTQHLKFFRLFLPFESREFSLFKCCHPLTLSPWKRKERSVRLESEGIVSSMLNEMCQKM